MIQIASGQPTLGLARDNIHSHMHTYKVCVLRSAAILPNAEKTEHVYLRIRVKAFNTGVGKCFHHWPHGVW